MNVPIDISGVTLHTKRLTLRPWREEDLEDFYAYASRDGVGQMAGWPPHESREVSRAVLERFIAGKKTFALEMEGKVIGSLGIERYSEDKLPELAPLKARELGFVLSMDCWGQGLMPEAVEAVNAYLFEDVGVDLVVCSHFLRNGQSARVQQKCGFTPYKKSLYRTLMGTVEETMYNLLTAEDWRKHRA